MSHHEIALQIDCRDDVCPLPVIALARHIDEVAVGEVLAVLARDPAARVDVPAWCRMRGHEFVRTDTGEDDVPRHVVRRLA